MKTTKMLRVQSFYTFLVGFFVVALLMTACYGAPQPAPVAPGNPPSAPVTPGNPPSAPVAPGNPPSAPVAPGNPPSAPVAPGSPVGPASTPSQVQGSTQTPKAKDCDTSKTQKKESGDHPPGGCGPYPIIPIGGLTEKEIQDKLNHTLDKVTHLKLNGDGPELQDSQIMKSHQELLKKRAEEIGKLILEYKKTLEDLCSDAKNIIEKMQCASKCVKKAKKEFVECKNVKFGNNQDVSRPIIQYK